MSESALSPPPPRLLIVPELVTWQRFENKQKKDPQTTEGSSRSGPLKSRFVETCDQKGLNPGQRPLQVISVRLERL